MINSLEEAISREEEMAKEQEKLACSLYERQDYEISKNCIWCAEEHRQLAEWLRALKEIWDSGDCNDCLHQNNCTIRPHLGQLVRFNCYQYERGIQNDNVNN